MTFSADLLANKIKRYPNAATIWIAYSGGCDSHVLLNAVNEISSELDAEIKAIHINHGLSHLAQDWEKHCQDTCSRLSIPYLSITVNVKDNKTSPEEAARFARYAEWNKLLNKNDLLLLGHHQDDQAETLLIQLLRGAGVKGLASMPEQQKFSAGWLCRPLLDFSRQELHDYAVENKLNWIDDPSNFDTDFDRNFLRHDVLPLLETRWPALKKTLSRSANHAAEADHLLSELAQQDWLQIHTNNQIKISELIKLTKQRQRNVLRYWLASVNQLKLPDTIHLQRILDEVIPAAEDAKPEVIWNGGEVRRFQGRLYAAVKSRRIPENLVIKWPDIKKSLNTDYLKLSAKAATGEGLSQNKLKENKITVRFRQGGETCRPAKRGQTHQLKKLFQEWQIPSWLRDSVPLLYVDDELAQVVGYCYCEPYAASVDELSWVVEVD